MKSIGGGDPPGSPLGSDTVNKMNLHGNKLVPGTFLGIHKMFSRQRYSFLLGCNGFVEKNTFALFIQKRSDLTVRQTSIRGNWKGN